MILSKYIIRERNEATVLKEIVDHEGISRAQIAQKTRLNKASVSSITSTLIENHLIFETGIGDASSVGGRKPILLEFNGEAGLVMALDIGYNYITAILTFLDGKKISSVSYENLFIQKTNILEHIDKIIRQFELDMPETPHGVIGLSLAIHGIVSENKILFTPYYDLDQMDLAHELEERYDYPVLLENEANLTALAEYCFAKEYHSVVAISVHSGIGAGIVIDGKLLTGKNGQAGEIGHSILVPHGKHCPCGNNGCLEQYASNKVLFERYATERKLAFANSHILTEALKHHDEVAEKLVMENMSLMAICVNNVAIMFNPEAIFINSSVYRKNSRLVEELHDKLNSFLLKDIELRTGTFHDLATLYGGVANLAMNFLNIQELHLRHPL
ncbi:ROK family transcriptional regulator [Enterococcus nangangensis]|uniref:ROK family transcriptional regulator n=1 Tax=Enterococcus nangangensis TaxID=2559926 RepID=UPI0010F4AF95|nr:ROK family transcriptional regulator [Enterococcus nangangensis]